MLTLRRHHHHRDTKRSRREAQAAAPWESAHAAPEDRALGLELELIELVHRRSIIGGDPEAHRQVDAEIDAVLHEIAAVAGAIRAA